MGDLQAHAARAEVPADRRCRRGRRTACAAVDQPAAVARADHVEVQVAGDPLALGCRQPADVVPRAIEAELLGAPERQSTRSAGRSPRRRRAARPARAASRRRCRRRSRPGPSGTESRCAPAIATLRPTPARRSRCWCGASRTRSPLSSARAEGRPRGAARPSGGPTRPGSAARGRSACRAAAAPIRAGS